MSTTSPPWDTPPCWTYDPGFGIVHLSRCHICLDYRRHLASASASGPTTWSQPVPASETSTDIVSPDSASFTAALKERDYQHQSHFLRGIDEGMRLQGELEENSRRLRVREDARLFERCVQMEKVSEEKTEELLRVKEELKLVKTQFEALRVLFDEMADANSFGEGYASHGGVPGQEEEGEHSLALGAEDYLDPFDVARETEALYAAIPAQQIPSPPNTPEPLPTSLPPAQSVEHVQNDPSVNDDAGDDDKPTPDNLVSDDEQMDIDTLTQLLEDARRPESTEARGRIKALCTAAHLTPRNARTQLQTFILHNWQGPTGTPSSPLPLPSPLPSPPLPSHPQIFVDASAWGIGFIMNDRWLSWKLKPGWNAPLSGRDINWSEMVAVELGLHVLIHAGLHRSSLLTIRSDNAGVVQALLTGRSKHERQGEVLRNVLHLANEKGIEVRPVWVSTKDNLADRYSRGEVEPRALMFPKVPRVPRHLEMFVEEAGLLAVVQQ